jgi:UDP-N-acetylmuramoyl-L-alanyl-D-glutamate--2,6-diaminopimelate ligase
VSTPRPGSLPPHPLRELAGFLGLPADPGAPDPQVTGVSLDSRSVLPGDLYAALPGTHTHGASHIPEALARGAVAVLTDTAVDACVPVLVVEDPRARLGALAAHVYGDPSTSMTLLGVTGTNGKTTTSYLLEAGLRAAGRRTGLIGTVETRIGEEVVASVRTTPEAPDLQALLAVMVERGVGAAAMEVSSHALALGRVDGTIFAVGVFTNLSQDHLDFHHSLEDYFAAKAKLFASGRCRTAVVNVDDPWGARLVELLRVPQVTVSLEGRPTADWRAGGVQGDAHGSSCRASGPAGEEVALACRLPGVFNLGNALAALATLVAAGLDPHEAAAGIAGLQQVPGRMERIDAGQLFSALVDYAHTPGAVASLLATLRPLTAGRLVVVVGCGGDRDRTKRPLMARGAVAGSDLAVFTSDNPRSEDPADILSDMTRELAPGGWVVEPDRRAAIALAVHGLGPGDTVVVAGKGHETGQESAGRVVAFDDRAELRIAVSAKAGAGG